MATFTRDTKDGPVELYYEVRGKGPSLLLFAPGGMRSAVSFWASTPWNPITELSATHKVIVMDQRNAGASKGPVAAHHGWHTFAEDHLALLEHLEVQELQVGGMCIGGPYSMGMIKALGERVHSAVLWQPIGADNNRVAFYEMFDSWAEGLQGESHSDVPAAAWQSFRSNMFDGDFLFNVDEDFVRQCQVPLLVLCGKDLYHPESTSRRVAELAPNAEFIEDWKTPEEIPVAKAQVADFLQRTSVS